MTNNYFDRLRSSNIFDSVLSAILKNRGLDIKVHSFIYKKYIKTVLTVFLK